MKQITEMNRDELLKYCIYYDGTEKSRENRLWGDYEGHWLNDCIDTNDKAFQQEVEYMIRCGISEEWLDSFGIPRSLIGIFFNRYCHWLGLYDIKDFMSWFEDVRNKKV